MRALTPATFEDAAAGLAAAASEGQAVRIRGGATKLDWGSVAATADVELRTSALDRILEHNVGDLTAVVQAGAPLARVQEQLSAEGQMLALDPPLGSPLGVATIGGMLATADSDPLGSPARATTIGGMLATADSGPLRHRYGGPRDLLLGITVALSDGTIARAGGKVIKNVAGYDLGKLFTGSFGTLGVILSASVRLHPLPAATATALGASADPDTLGDAAAALAQAPLELESLDVGWRSGGGRILARVAGAEAVPRAQRAAGLMRSTRLEPVEVVDDDASLWARQRAGQRSREHAIVRVAARPRELRTVLRATAGCGGTLVGRAALGISYIAVEPEAAAGLRRSLPPKSVSVLLDAPASLRASIDPWGGHTEGPALELMRRVKARFDPGRACNPGVFVGGI